MIISLSINVTYQTKPDAKPDMAVHGVMTNLWELLDVAGIGQDGKPKPDIRISLPLFCPPPLQALVEIIDVKPLIVTGPSGDEDDVAPN